MRRFRTLIRTVRHAGEVGSHIAVVKQVYFDRRVRTTRRCFVVFPGSGASGFCGRDPWQGLLREGEAVDIEMLFALYARGDYDTVVTRARFLAAPPWTRISATVAYFSPFASSFKFLFDVRTYFWDAYDSSGKIDGWRIHQNALHYALGCAASANVRVRDLSSTALDSLVDVNKPAEAKAELLQRIVAKRPSGDVQGMRSFS